ncbi:ectoine/hydroxyectoine ABC transporter ATP-binding protein EhuA [Pseudomonas sp. dw_358]|uniref:ectoine/hydroxyectoine ABC transporter ATP-binding protein EhuA n=1 Tax=Pseudomonas sp. dw_358 TaxID=2720083 RepID=UPI0023DF8D47|nr:ectoine/hydroxyectoine ABC transporter ATP-binding protein EhuA [Pseudomonas sp. dw_358]
MCASDPLPMIEYKNVIKSYGHLQVLKDFSMTINKGERIALIGPSGSGKTTVLRTLMTLETIQGGAIFMEGEPLWHVEKQGHLVPAPEAHLRKMRRNVGMVFQHFNLFPHKTALENVAEPPHVVLAVNKEAAALRAHELLRMVGLESKVNHRPAQLSGGQQQRVAIARALAMQPQILLFDEPTSALDPELVEEVLTVLREVGKSTDTTMLLVTHEMEFASEFADRVVFMDAGRIVEQAPPDQLFTAPQEERTRSFLKKILASGRTLKAPNATAHT